MNDLLSFFHEGLGELRALADDEGDTMWAAPDLARILGTSELLVMSRAREYRKGGLRRHVRDGVAEFVPVICEFHMFNILEWGFSCRLPAAGEPRLWILRDVIPSLLSWEATI
jgi:prophage antirepressor-like protein